MRPEGQSTSESGGFDMRAKVSVAVAALALALALGASSARADQISLADSCSGRLTAASGPISVLGSVSGCFASFESGGSSTPDFAYSINSAGTTASFSISGNGQSLTGTITWTNVASGTIDLTLLNGTVCGEEGPCIVSGGEVPVAEPGTLTLLGTGLVTLGGFLRKFRS
jgi:hypothetical protein